MPTRSGSPPPTSTAFSRAPSPATCRSSARTNTQLIINLKTAKALGLTVPLPLAASPTR